MTGMSDSSSKSIPAHREIPLEGFQAYADRESVLAGETISFHTSSPVPYEIGIYRLGTKADEDDVGEDDCLLANLPPSAPRIQPITPGSYIVAEGLPPAQVLAQVTLECWVRWTPDKHLQITTERGVFPIPIRGVLTQYDYGAPGTASCSFGLYITLTDAGTPALGRLHFYLGNGGDWRETGDLRSADNVLTENEWHHVVGNWDGQTRCIFLDGEIVAGPDPFTEPVAGGMSPIRIGAYADNGIADHFLNGDVAMPAIYDQALTRDQILARFADGGMTKPVGGVIGCWPLTEERGCRVSDISPNGRHGRIINNGTWMIGGPKYNARQGPFDPHDPASEPTTRGHGLRLASDDLFDCRWDITERYTLPIDSKPGLYVARCSYALDGEPRTYHVTFVVRRANSRQQAPIVVLANSNTWRAYNTDPFGKQDALLDGHLFDFPRYSFYYPHAPAEQSTYVLGRHIPVPSADPFLLYEKPTQFSHLARAERFTHAWLEKLGYSYDMISDFDLDREPDILQGYKVLVLAGHPEYWTWPMCKALADWQAAGGNLLSLAGNAFIWRASNDEEGATLECRKIGASLGGFGEGDEDARRGESWHSHDGQRGGLLRNLGYSGQLFSGLMYFALTYAHVDEAFTPYIVKLPDHSLFHEPLETGLQGFDLRLMSWGDGSAVPTSGNGLVIVGIDNNGLLHIRIFDAAGNRITDTDETRLPSAQAGAVSTLKQQLPDLLPPHVLTSAEKARLISETTSIVGQTRLQPGETFGQRPGGGLPRAVGHEFDVRIATLLLYQDGPPPGATAPETQPGIECLADSIIENSSIKHGQDYYGRALNTGNQGGELIYWERPDGGRVFNAGSVSAGPALAVDAKFSALVQNALFRFGVQPPTL